MKNLHRRAFVLSTSLALATGAGTSWAQSYPSKPITIVVAYPAGGGTDQVARLFAEKLAVRLGQPVVVENRVGATGTIGSSYVAKAPPDGYTLLMTPATLSFAQMVLKVGPGAAYDPLNGFTPIMQAGRIPLFLVAGQGVGVRNLKELVEASKTRKLSFGTAGVGSIHHILAEIVNDSTGMRLEHVPYKGVAPAVADVLGGHIPMMYASLDTVLPHLSSGKLIPLAVFDSVRTPLAPNVPTAREMGYDIDFTTWCGVFGPKGVPPAVVKTLNEHMNEILKMPDVIASMAKMGIAASGGSTEALANAYAEDYLRIGKVIKDLNIRVD